MNAHFPPQEKWDETTKQAVEIIRSHLHREPQPTLTAIQKESRKARRLKGPFRQHKATIPTPAEDDIRQLFLEVVDEIQKIDFKIPNLVPVDVEWIGFSGHKAGGLQEPNEQKAETYETLIEASSNDLVLLHVHGGAYW